MEDRQMKHPDDRTIARLMGSLEGHVTVAAGHTFDLAAGKRRFMAWLQEGGDKAGDENGTPGSASSGERLGVTQLGYSPRVTRILLGGRLRRLREIAAITREEAGYQIRCSGSKISRMELGRIGFKQRDVVDLLDLYGVTDPHERDELLYLVGQANEPPWWREYSDILPEWFEVYLALEEVAAEIRSYDACVVPELLQTEGYARALAWQASPGAADWEIDRRLQILKERQAALSRPGAPRLRALIDEAALRRPVGGTDVMRDQYGYLAEASRLPGTTIQVVPLSSGTGSVVGCSFVVLRFTDPDLADVTYLPQITGAIYMDVPSDVARYVKALDVMEGCAEGPPRMAAILGNSCRNG